MSGPTKFTPEQDTIIRSAAASGHSQQEVANLLGMTKNRVVGRAHRLKIAFGGSDRYERKACAVEPPVQVSMKDGCSFIAGDPAEIRQGRDVFCGEERKPGSPYCEAHHARCRIPPRLKMAGKTAEHVAQ